MYSCSFTNAQHGARSAAGLFSSARPHSLFPPCFCPHLALRDDSGRAKRGVNTANRLAAASPVHLEPRASGGRASIDKSAVRPVSCRFVGEHAATCWRLVWHHRRRPRRDGLDAAISFSLHRPASRYEVGCNRSTGVAAARPAHRPSTAAWRSGKGAGRSDGARSGGRFAAKWRAEGAGHGRST